MSGVFAAHVCRSVLEAFDGGRAVATKGLTVLALASPDPRSFSGDQSHRRGGGNVAVARGGELGKTQKRVESKAVEALL